MCSLETVFIKIAEAAGDPELIAKRRTERRALVSPGTAAGTELATAVRARPLAPTPGTAPAVAAVSQDTGGADPPASASAGAPPGNGPSGGGTALRAGTITRAAGEKLGMDLAATVGVDGIRVEAVYEGYAAYRSRALLAGDVIVSVNGTRIAGLARADVMSLLAQATGTVELEINDAAQMTGAQQGGVLASAIPSRPVAMATASALPMTSTRTPAELEGAHDGAHALSDPHNVLGFQSSFARTPFRLQFNAVARKSRIMLRRQWASTW